MNIPIYRAKKMNSDEYIEGEVNQNWNKTFIKKSPYWNYEVNPNTLAIHLPGMLDKNDKKIFASLSIDGVGGDKLLINGHFGVKFQPFSDTNILTALMSDTGVVSVGFMTINNINHFNSMHSNNVFEVVGIRQSN